MLCDKGALLPFDSIDDFLFNWIEGKEGKKGKNVNGVEETTMKEWMKMKKCTKVKKWTKVEKRNEL